MDSLWIMLFAITTGFTASGIVANLYRISGAKAATNTGQTVRLAVMAIAGPTVIFEYAMRGYLGKEWTPLVFWMVVGAITYWSLAIGLFVLDVAMHI